MTEIFYRGLLGDERVQGDGCWHVYARPDGRTMIRMTIDGQGSEWEMPTEIAARFFSEGNRALSTLTKRRWWQR